MKHEQPIKNINRKSFMSCSREKEPGKNKKHGQLHGKPPPFIAKRRTPGIGSVPAIGNSNLKHYRENDNGKTHPYIKEVEKKITCHTGSKIVLFIKP